MPLAELLRDADLDVVTAKTVRRSLEQHFGLDLTDRKKEIADIINSVLNSSSPAPSSPKRERSTEQEDEQLARRLQEEEESGKRATRSRGSKGPASRRSKQLKTKERVSSDESDADSDSDAASGSESSRRDRKKADKSSKNKGKGQKGGYLVSKGPFGSQEAA